jgi:menaquinone-9 beta-reductase
LRVVVADRARPSIDKACGEGLMPDALAALARLGVVIRPEDGFPFRGIRFAGSGASARASLPVGAGLGLRRTTLHRILAEQAQECGVNLQWGASVSGFGPGFVIAAGQRVRYEYLVGADGEASAVRRWAGLDDASDESRRFGFRRHYDIEPWSDCVEVHWADGCQIYVTPVAPRQVGLALLSRDPALRLDRALDFFPELAARVRGAAPASQERGAVSVSRRLRRVCNDRIALVGDASGSVDAVTGEGLCLAFRQAVALGECLAGGDLSPYQAAHHRIRRGPAGMAALLLMLDRHPVLRRRALSALAMRPSAFSAMLSMHIGAASWRPLAPALLSLGWGLLVS